MRIQLRQPVWIGTATTTVRPRRRNFVVMGMLGVFGISAAGLIVVAGERDASARRQAARPGAQSRTTVLPADSDEAFQSAGTAVIQSAGTVVDPETRIRDLRKKFAYQSLKPRLAYEQNRRVVSTGGRKSDPQPTLTDATKKRLAAAEKSSMGDTNIRTQSLKMLHSRQVQKFIRSQGFGVSRMAEPKPSPEFLEYPEPEPIRPLAARTAESPGKHESAGDDVAVAFELPARGVRDEPRGAWTPSFEMLNDFHAQDQIIFASPWSFGDVKDVDHVAGFRSHGFYGLPELVHPKNENREGVETIPARWRIGQLELVSLLKHDEPSVYVSDDLPRMNELSSETVKTRPPTSFEAEALAKLNAGEDLVADAGPNEIRLVGSLRATKQCLQCHAGPRGSLLGAFTYRLHRDPPVAAWKRAPKSPT